MSVVTFWLLAFFAPSIVYALFVVARRRPRRPSVVPFVGPWETRHIIDTWYVSRRIGETIENLYYPPPGYKEPRLVASFKTKREAQQAARKANAETTNH